jgi:hypothetical protein
MIMHASIKASRVYDYRPRVDEVGEPSIMFHKADCQCDRCIEVRRLRDLADRQLDLTTMEPAPGPCCPICGREKVKVQRENGVILVCRDSAHRHVDAGMDRRTEQEVRGE